MQKTAAKIEQNLHQQMVQLRSPSSLIIKNSSTWQKSNNTNGVLRTESEIRQPDKTKDIVSLVAESKAILGVGAGGLAHIPRIKQLNDSILRIKKGSYITVTGWKGNGKTCLIDTTLNRHLGVVKISTESGASKSVIIDQALRALTGIQFEYFKPVGSARRLLFFYSLLFKGRSPIVVIRVPECQIGEPYAQVTSAVRDLADLYGLRVVVDGSPNSLPPELLATKRETVIAIVPMSKERIESIPEFKDLIDFLKSHNLNEPVWKVFVGSPADYLKLEEAIIDNKLSLSDTASDVVVNQVKDQLQSVLSDTFNKNVLNSSANTQAIIDAFREKKAIKIPKVELKAMGLLLDYPNKVFRERIFKMIKVFLNCETMEGWYIVPSSPAAFLIITENIQNDKGVRELRDKLFKTT
eukprot:gene13667-18340_t